MRKLLFVASFMLATLLGSPSHARDAQVFRISNGDTILVERVKTGGKARLFPPTVLAHGGGLDANGGHFNRRTGEYHYHRSPSAGQSRSARRSPARAAPLMQSQPEQEQPKASIADEIKKLHDLHKQGILSKEEYEQGKKKLLRQ